MLTETEATDESTSKRVCIESLPVALWLVAACFLFLACVDAHRNVHFGLDSELVWRGVRSFVDHRPVDLFYLPSSLVLLAPFELLPLGAAKLLALAVTAASFVVTSCAAGKLAGRGAFGALSAVVLIVMSASAIGRSALVLSNVGLAVQAALAVVLVLASLGRWRAAAVIFTIACCIKPNVAPAGLIFVACKQWRSVGTIVLGFAATNLLGLVLLTDVSHYVGKVVTFATTARGSIGSVSLTAANNFAVSVSGPGLRVPSIAITITRILVLVAAVFVIRKTWSPSPSREQLTSLAITPVLANFLAGGLAEPHYALVAMPLAAILFLSPDVIVASLAALGSWFILYGGRIPEQISIAERLTIGALLLIVAMLWAARQRAGSATTKAACEQGGACGWCGAEVSGWVPERVDRHDRPGVRRAHERTAATVGLTPHTVAHQVRLALLGGAVVAWLSSRCRAAAHRGRAAHAVPGRRPR